jgi:hypothetical protein
METKLEYISNEGLRIHLRCSDQEKVHAHFSNFRDRLKQGGYPERVIDRQFTRARKRYEGILKQVENGTRPLYRSREFRVNQNKEKPKGVPGPPVLWIPAGNPNFTKEVREAVEKSGLEIQVKEKAGMPLRSLLSSSALKPGVCKNPRCKLCPTNETGGKNKWGPKPKCHDKDIVYGIQCHICGERYIGETKQRAADRFRQHYPSETNANKDSSVAKHHSQKHPDQEPNLEMVVLGRGRGFVSRKSFEAVVIHDEQPEINQIKAGKEVMDLYF